MAVILLDCDGVLSNFADAAIRVCGQNPKIVWSECPTPKEAWDFFKSWGMTSSDFYQTLEIAGERFWENLEPYPQALDLVAYCQTFAPTYLCTAPTLDPMCPSGKLKWIQKHFGKHFTNYIITRHKYLFANSQTLLVDDNEDNCAKFAEHGGRCVLVPRRWNRLYRDEELGYGMIRELIALTIASMEEEDGDIVEAA